MTLDIRHSTFPLLLSLAGVLIIAGMGVRVGRKMFQPPAEPTRTVKGPLPFVRQGMPLPEGLGGDGRVFPRACRAGGGRYTVYSPKDFEPERPCPVLLWLAGREFLDGDAPRTAGLAKLADELHYLVVTPESGEKRGHPYFSAGPSGESETTRSARATEVTNMDGRKIRMSPFFGLAAIVAEMNEDWYVEEGAMVAVASPGTADLARRLAADRSGRWAGVIDADRGLAALAESCEAMFGKLAPVRIALRPASPGSPPAAVTVRAAASSRIGKIKAYAWDFGALSAGTRYDPVNKVHIDQPGEYPIKLLIVDAMGNRYRAQTTLTVPAKE